MAEEKGKPGRPRVFVRRHKIELPFDVEEVKELLKLHETAQIAKGFLSTNAGVLIATFGALSAMLAFPPTQALVASFIAFWRNQIVSVAHEVFNPLQLIPDPEVVVEEVIKGAGKISDAARKAGEEIRGIEAERARQAREKLEEGELAVSPAGLIPTTEELRRILREAGETVN